MDKFAKRLQSRLSAKGHRFTKDECRQALACSSANPELPTEDEMILAFNRLTSSAQEEAPAIILVEAEEIIQDQELSQESQELSQESQELSQESQELSQESSLTVPENSSQMAQAPVSGISQTEMTQAITQAVAQIGAESNAETIALLTSLANELSEDINSVQEMASALITAYLGKRENILASAIGTIKTLRSAQTSSFQSGLNQDFFDQKKQSRQKFMSQIQATFN